MFSSKLFLPKEATTILNPPISDASLIWGGLFPSLVYRGREYCSTTRVYSLWYKAYDQSLYRLSKIHS